MVKSIVSIDNSQELGAEIHHLKSEKNHRKKLLKIRIPFILLG